MKERADDLQRWLILGHCGVGKSTLAVAMGQHLGLPVIHLDRLSWGAGWVEEDREVFHERVRKATAGEKWIIDGNYSSSLASRLPRAQAVVWLDYSLPRCLLGICRRYVQWRGRARPDMAEGCPERLSVEFLVWTVTHYGLSRRRVKEAMEGEADRLRVWRFTHPGQTRWFLQELCRGPEASSPAPLPRAP